MIPAATSWTALTVTAVTFLTLGIASVRLFGCGQCRAVHDQELTLIKRLLGDQDMYVQRHRLRRHRPFTCPELLDLLKANGALLDEERWQELGDNRRVWRANGSRPHRALHAIGPGEPEQGVRADGNTSWASNGVGAL
jgi:hypothetical protein